MSQCYLDRLPLLPDGKYQPRRAISPSARWLWSQEFAWRQGAWRRPQTLAASPPPGTRTQKYRQADRQTDGQAGRQADAHLSNLSPAVYCQIVFRNKRLSDNVLSANQLTLVGWTRPKEFDSGSWCSCSSVLTENILEMVFLALQQHADKNVTT